MESVLLVSCSEKGNKVFIDLLKQASVHKIAAVSSCARARQLLMEYEYDLCMINAPLPDENGISLAKHVAAMGSTQTILIVRGEYTDAIADAVEPYGVICLGTPISKNLLWSALRLAGAAQNKYRSMQDEVGRLTKKIEDIRIIDRAKCVLISVLQMTEQEAHKHIEKQAMDMRVTKKAIAEGILKQYENE